MKKPSKFTQFANQASKITGRSYTFVIAISVVLLWAVSGPLFGFSDTWQLIIGTITTIVTFLMVFLIQNTQNRDTEAIQIKLDELLRSTGPADIQFMDMEEMEEEELEKFRKRFIQMAREAREKGTNVEIREKDIPNEADPNSNSEWVAKEVEAEDRE